MKLHILKIEPQYYDAVIQLRKKAELRLNDRDFKIGDLLHFVRLNGEEYDGNMNSFIITHTFKASEVITPFEKDYIVLSIEPYKTFDARMR